ncbi:unnamed protein product [Mytilus coruscus]|uniref:Uncharacterized protein n=1 Tax=Mytilus coruscus TaxID=42192 RepID=A0A6J8EJV8_MYTCO|nr:unnamed protein product [Mytilus coruscus]
MLLTGIKNKCCSRRRKSEHKNGERQYPAEESVEMNRYEYIDEENITDQNPSIFPPSLPVLKKHVQHQFSDASDNDYTNSKNGQHGIRIEDEGYLNPYQPIQEANIYKHEYKAICSAITKIKETDEYLHQYNSLLKHGMSEGHEYRNLRNQNIKSKLKSSENDEFQSFV